MEENEVKSYKWGSFKNKPPKNAVIYVLNPSKGAVEAFVTDRFGNPVPLSIGGGINIEDYVKTGPNNNIIVEGGKLFVKKYNSGDEFIIVEESTNDYKLRLNVDKIEILDNKQNSLEIDGTGTKYPTVDAVNEAIESIVNTIQPIKHYFSNSVQETVNHNLGRYPNVIVLEGTELIIPNSIEHTPDMNSVTVTFLPETTGLIIIQ